MTKLNLIDLVEHLKRLTPYSWQLLVDSNGASVICENELVYTGTYEEVERRILDLLSIMIEVLNDGR